MSVFDETLPTTTKGTLRASTVAALLRRRRDLQCSLTWSFASIGEDGTARVEQHLSNDEVIANYLTQPSTLAVYCAERLGCAVLVISTAASAAFAHDAAYRSRRAVVDAMPCFAIPRDRQTPLLSGQRFMFWGALQHSIRSLLDARLLSDASFAECVTRMATAGVDAIKLAAFVAAEKTARARCA